MAIDYEVETLIPFHEARSALPGRKRVALPTLHRWRLHGVRGVRLETVLVGGLRYTSREAIRRFIATQNRDEQSAPTITPTQRHKQSNAARAALAEAGV